MALTRSYNKIELMQLQKLINSELLVEKRWQVGVLFECIKYDDVIEQCWMLLELNGDKTRVRQREMMNSRVKNNWSKRSHFSVSQKFKWKSLKFEAIK